MADERNDNLPGVSPDLSAEELKKAIGEQTPPQAETPEATPETPAPKTPGQADKKVEEPPLILGKFKTHEDMEKSYQELEKRSTKAEQLKSKYREIMDPYVEFDQDGNAIGLKPQQSSKTPQGQAQQDVLQMLEERYNRYVDQYGHTRAMLMLNTEIASAVAQQHTAPIDDLRADTLVENQKKKLRDRSDFSKYEPEIDMLLGKMDVKSKLSPKAVETLYYMVKGRNAEKEAKEQQDEAQLQTAEIEKQKQKAQVEHQTKTPEEPKPDIDSLSSKELAAQFGLKKIDRY